MTNDQEPVLSLPKEQRAKKKIRLREEAVDVAGGDSEGRSRLIRRDRAFAVLAGERPTGMALTPSYQIKNGQPLTGETWGVTHVDTGRLIAGGFDDLRQAEGLAARLAGLDWSRPFETMPRAGVQTATRIIHDSRAGLAERAQAGTADAWTGQLVRDGLGDPAYVVEDHGLKVMLANQGGRYAMPRTMIAPLSEAACRAAKLAQPVEPADGAACLTCGLTANQQEIQEWHRIAGSLYCHHCARDAARRAGYTFGQDWLEGISL